MTIILAEEDVTPLHGLLFNKEINVAQEAAINVANITDSSALEKAAIGCKARTEHAIQYCIG